MKKSIADTAPRDMVQVGPYIFVNVESAHKLGLRGIVVPAHGIWDSEARHAAARVDAFLSSVR